MTAGDAAAWRLRAYACTWLWQTAVASGSISDACKRRRVGAAGAPDCDERFDMARQRRVPARGR